MTIAALMVHTVTIKRASTTTDRYGDTAADFDTATSTTTVAWISQRAASEIVNGREAQLSEWVAFLPADADVLGQDRIIWGDITFEVVGPPNHAWSPRGENHIEAVLKVVNG